MKKLQNLVSQLEYKIPFYEKTNPLVSNSTIGWQIEHSLKTIYQIVQVVKNSNPKEYQWKFNKNNLLISIIGFIPRGKAKAPKVVMPDNHITEESLKNSLQKVKSALQEWDYFHKNAHFPHPYFGKLNKKSTEWFLNLHTKHHLKIINDIYVK
jgi:hypothetical protein